MKWENIVKYLVFFRKQLVLIFTLSFYMLAVYYFFIQPKILIALIFTILFFVFTHYFIIELKKTDIWNLIVLVTIVVIANILLLGYLWTDNIFYTLGLVTLHLGILFLFWDIYEEVYNRITINSWKIFTMWARMFSLILSLTFALSFLGTYRSFNLTCNQIYDLIQKTSKIAINYFDIHLPIIKKDLQLREIIPNAWTWNIQPQFTGIKLNYLVKPDFWKFIIINQIVKNKRNLDKSICQIIVINIKEKYNKPWFQFTVMFLIFMLFYPLIRLIIFILAIINWIIFQLARLAKIYNYKKIIEEVEMIE